MLFIFRKAWIIRAGFRDRQGETGWRYGLVSSLFSNGFPKSFRLGEFIRPHTHVPGLLFRRQVEFLGILGGGIKLSHREIDLGPAARVRIEIFLGFQFLGASGGGTCSTGDVRRPIVSPPRYLPGSTRRSPSSHRASRLRFGSRCPSCFSSSLPTRTGQCFRRDGGARGWAFSGWVRRLRHPR